jgi:hypothetical protein
MTRYKEAYSKELVDRMAEGMLDCEICSKWRISRNTFYRWIREHDEFREAFEVGSMCCETWWAEWGKKGMRGEIKGFSFNAWIAFMNNKFKWAKNALTDPGNVTNNIMIGNIQVNNQLPRQDLIEKIKLIGNKHSDILNVEYIEVKPDDQS